VRLKTKMLPGKWVKCVRIGGAIFLLAASWRSSRAQNALPNAPSTAITQSPGQLPQSLSGAVQDVGGTPVGEATVSLVGPSGFARATTTDDDGEYRFDGVPVGDFTLTVKAEGLADGSARVTVAVGEHKAVEEFTLRLEEAKFQIDAVSQVELADEQIKQEETQRIFGAIPNFYVAYDQNTVSMTQKQKFKLASRTFIDPVTFISAGISAGINQALQAPVDWGQDLTGFGQRYGAQMVGAAAGVGFSGFLFPVIFHQDPRYFYKGTGTKTSRTWWALKQSIEQKSDNGHWEPAYSNMLGDVASTLATVAVYPHQDVNWGATAAENFGISIASQAFGNIMEEFVVPKLKWKKHTKTP
jgi:hypothetical protein